jgi:hypothetical protein
MTDKKMTDFEINALAERLAERLTEIEAERIEAERIEAERIEAERIEAERIEAERIEANKIKLVKMKNDKGIIADVHPKEVENYKKGNYVKV